MSKCDKSSFCMTCSRSKFEVKVLTPVHGKETLIGYFCEDHYDEAEVQHKEKERQQDGKKRIRFQL
ncbi:hypothetical protein [Fictibacillus fluitans]|uniref:DUF2197 domain-containing protein n=1 Tax=Fictibacillus fluitans TaxID=3058422 RepID=A0ABT8HYY7_9BACL|nr:hypothetical protein [Fictibacillus sp. NE201]MDN4525984.1 hypothetical protein [Fictibacillus sp. NE201]